MKCFSFIAAVYLLFLSCSSPEKKENQQVQELQFPYPESLDSFDDDGILVIGDDGNGFTAISHKIRYPKVPDTLNLSQFADSLLQCYNICLAYNTLAYDAGTADRYKDETDYSVEEQANALDSINVAGISYTNIREALIDVAQKVAYGMRYYQKNKEHDKTQGLEDADNTFYGLYNTFLESLLEGYPSKNDIVFDPTIVIKDYQSIHKMAISATLNCRNELMRQVLQEKNYQKACVLAREFAYANHKVGEEEMLVAVIDKLLRTDQYSPLLRELWLMWRTSLQILWGGYSNDSSMYNLFYNDMRNHVALVYLAHINDHPHDNLAIQEFLRLAMEHNIARNSGCLAGNNAIIDEMDLYRDCMNIDMDEEEFE